MTERRVQHIPAACRRVDSMPTPDLAGLRRYEVEIKACVACGSDIYVSRVTRERTSLFVCDRCTPAEVREAIMALIDAGSAHD